MPKTPPKSLKIEILDIIKTLKKAGKYRLSNCIEQNWDKSILTYSTELNTYKPKKKMEPELLSAFRLELERIEINKDTIHSILNNLKENRILQTAPHLGATQSPRMFCIDWLSSLGISKDDSYIVGMFSGIPFSNRSRPGRINKKSDSINLFPSTMQDGLVYRSTIPDKLVKTIPTLKNNLKKLLPKAILGHSYTKWALQTCANIERQILKKENLYYLDINEVVTNYLIQVLEKKDHILYKIFFDSKTNAEFVKTFPNEIMFYSPFMNGKYETMENMIFSKNKLKSRHKEINLDKIKELIKELKDGRLCPSLITLFLVLTFLNEFKCFGSFAQVEYLPVYQEKFANFLKDNNIKHIPTANLTTGVFPSDRELYPADIILGEIFEPKTNILFGELLISMKKTLLESYFTGDERKNKNK